MKYYILVINFKREKKEVLYLKSKTLEEAKLGFMMKIRPKIENKQKPFDSEPVSVDLFECVDFETITEDVRDVFVEGIF